MLHMEKFEQVLQEIIARWGIPGLGIEIVEEDKIVYARGFGVQRLNAPILQYLPSFRLDDDRYTQTTTRLILSHTSRFLQQEKPVRSCFGSPRSFPPRLCLPVHQRARPTCP